MYYFDWLYSQLLFTARKFYRNQIKRKKGKTYFVMKHSSQKGKRKVNLRSRRYHIGGIFRGEKIS